MKTNTKIDTTIPRWDLSSIYTSFQGDDFENAMTKVAEGNNELNALLSDYNPNINFDKWLISYLEIENQIDAEFESLYAYTEAISSTDTTNTESLNIISKLDDISLELSKTELSFLEILNQNKDKIGDFCQNNEKFAEYQYVLNKRILGFSHNMTKAEENLAEDLQRTGGDAWSRLQGQIISNLVDKETGKTFNQLRNEAYSDSKETRKTAYEKELALLERAKIPLAACLNNLKGATVTLNRRRNWTDAIERSLSSARISKKTLDSLIGAIEASLPFWQDYLKTKANILGDGDALPFYDLFAPLPNKNPSEEKVWTFEEAKNYIIERYSSFSSHMGDFAKMAFEQNWIDAEVRKGKVGGAYCTSFPAHKQARVLTNFTGTFSDILTLAHELGHAYHDHCIHHKDYALLGYPMTLAETASIFAETIVMEDMLSKTEEYEKAKLAEMHLSDGCQVLVDILSRFYFEKSVFEKKEAGLELSAEDFCNLMLEAQNRSYGKGLKDDEKHSFMWALKVHYYSPELDFYNFPYAFGQLFALALYARYKKEGKSFTEVYQQLLATTGSKSCEEVCKEAGFDIETKDFWLSGIKEFQSNLDILKEY